MYLSITNFTVSQIYQNCDNPDAAYWLRKHNQSLVILRAQPKKAGKKVTH